MDAKAILDLYDQEMRRDAPANRAHIHKRPGLTYFLALPPSPRAGWVIYTRLDASNAEDAISSTVDFFRDHGGEFEWKVYDHDTPPDLKKRLAARGFEAEELEAVLALDMDETPEGFWEPSEVTIRRIMDPNELAAVMRIENEVWAEPTDELEAGLAAEMTATPDQLSVYLAYVGDEAACACVDPLLSRIAVGGAVWRGDAGCPSRQGALQGAGAGPGPGGEGARCALPGG